MLPLCEPASAPCAACMGMHGGEWCHAHHWRVLSRREPAQLHKLALAGSACVMVARCSTCSGVCRQPHARACAPHPIPLPNCCAASAAREGDTVQDNPTLRTIKSDAKSPRTPAHAMPEEQAGG